jgi:hypothetical protein
MIEPYPDRLPGDVMNAPMMTAPCTAVRRDDVVPTCLFCEAELSEVYLRKLRRLVGSRFLDTIAEDLTVLPEGP